MKSTFLALAIATAALNIFAPAVGHAQDYIVNGHNASKAEAHFLASFSAQAGTGRSMDMAYRELPIEHPAPPVVKTAGRKCWYVLDVQLCD
jgi:hypothetical protein